MCVCVFVYVVCVCDRVPFRLRCIFSIFTIILEWILVVVLTIGGDRLHLGKFDVYTFSVMMVLLLLLLRGVSQTHTQRERERLKNDSVRYFGSAIRVLRPPKHTITHHHHSAPSKLHSVPEISITLTETWIGGGMRQQNKYEPPNAEIHNTHVYTHSSDGAAPSAAFAITNNDDKEKKNRRGKTQRGKNCDTLSRQYGESRFSHKNNNTLPEPATFLCNKTDPADFFYTNVFVCFSFEFSKGVEFSFFGHINIYICSMYFVLLATSHIFFSQTQNK